MMRTLRYTNENGQVALVIATTMLAVSIAVIATFASIGLGEGLAARTLQNSKQSYYAAEGALEYATMSLVNGQGYAAGPHAVGGATATISEEAKGAGTYYIARGEAGNAQRSVSYIAPGGVPFDMPYAAYAGYMGIEFNSAQAAITGNVFSFGSIQGQSASQYNNINDASVLLAAHPGREVDELAKNEASLPSVPAATECPSGGSASSYAPTAGVPCIGWRKASYTEKIAQSFSVARAGQPTKLLVYAAAKGSPGSRTIKIVGSKLVSGSYVPDASDVYATGNLNITETTLGWRTVTLTPSSGKFLVTPQADEPGVGLYWILFTTGTNSNTVYYKLGVNFGAQTTNMLYWSNSESTWATNSATADIVFQLHIGVDQTTIDRVTINDNNSCVVGYDVEADVIEEHVIIYAETVRYRDTLDGDADVNCSATPAQSNESSLTEFTPPIPEEEINRLLTIADAHVCGSYCSGGDLDDPNNTTPRDYPSTTDSVPGFVVPGDFIVSGTDQTLNIRGIIHVRGDMELKGAQGVAVGAPGCTIQVGSDLGAKSAVIIVDGSVIIRNKCIVKGSGDTEGKSHLVIIARGLNNGSSPVVDIFEQASADIIMATRGTVRVRDSAAGVRAKAVAAPYIVLDGNAEISTGIDAYTELVIPSDTFSYARWGEVE